jgi:hypothetical protein
VLRFDKAPGFVVNRRTDLTQGYVT